MKDDDLVPSEKIAELKKRILQLQDAISEVPVYKSPLTKFFETNGYILADGSRLDDKNSSGISKNKI